jgi:hypothetical protein
VRRGAFAPCPSEWLTQAEGRALYQIVRLPIRGWPRLMSVDGQGMKPGFLRFIELPLYKRISAGSPIHRWIDADMLAWDRSDADPPRGRFRNWSDVRHRRTNAGTLKLKRVGPSILRLFVFPPDIRCTDL